MSTHSDESRAHRGDTRKDPVSGANLGGAQRNQTYKPHQRNPLFSGAENSCLWELNRLSRHYHPSVCLFARTLMKVSFDLVVVSYTEHDRAISCPHARFLLDRHPSQSVRVVTNPNPQCCS